MHSRLALVTAARPVAACGGSLPAGTYRCPRLVPPISLRHTKTGMAEGDGNFNADDDCAVFGDACECLFQFLHALLQPVEEFYFTVSECPVEDGQVIHVANIGGAQHQLHACRIPAKR